MVETLSQAEDAELKDVDYYMRLSYPIELVYDYEENCWLARMPDLPGCISDGADPNEVVKNASDARHAWIETCIEDGQEVPLPTYEKTFAFLAGDRKEVTE